MILLSSNDKVTHQSSISFHDGGSLCRALVWLSLSSQLATTTIWNCPSHRRLAQFLAVQSTGVRTSTPRRWMHAIGWLVVDWLVGSQFFFWEEKELEWTEDMQSQCFSSFSVPGPLEFCWKLLLLKLKCFGDFRTHWILHACMLVVGKTEPTDWMNSCPQEWSLSCHSFILCSRTSRVRKALMTLWLSHPLNMPAYMLLAGTKELTDWSQDKDLFVAIPVHSHIRGSRAAWKVMSFCKTTVTIKRPCP